MADSYSEFSSDNSSLSRKLERCSKGGRVRWPTSTKSFSISKSDSPNISVSVDQPSEGRREAELEVESPTLTRVPRGGSPPQPPPPIVVPVEEEEPPSPEEQLEVVEPPKEWPLMCMPRCVIRGSRKSRLIKRENLPKRAKMDRGRAKLVVILSSDAEQI